MSLSPFGRSKPKISRGTPPKMDDVSLNDFSGGLDLSDSDLKLKTNFAKVLDNMHRDVDGGLSARFGTVERANATGVISGDIIEEVYFRDRIVIFTTLGEVATYDFTTGLVELIWNNDISYGLPGNPSAWTISEYIDTTEFKNELVCCNGVDKPILIDKNFHVTYLQDLAIGSNIFTPIARFVTTVGNYCVMAGIPASPDELYISSSGTSGTWPGDAPPNDAVSINIASYNAATGGDLRSIASFRNYLVVYFATSSLLIALGEYDGAVHKPRVEDTIGDQGIISHRMSTTIAQDFVFADEQGTHKASKNVFGATLDTAKLSNRIVPDFVKYAPTTLANRLKSFLVHNKLEKRLMFFFYQGDGYKIFVLSFDDGLKRFAWSTYSGFGWTCGCATNKGRVFFASGKKIYQLGNDVFAGEDYAGDMIGDGWVTWTSATDFVVDNIVKVDDVFYRCRADHNSSVFNTDLEADLWEVDRGAEIDTDWEMPWTDTASRMKKKRLSYIHFDTEGSARFTVEAYIDNFRYTPEGADDPIISLEFTAGDSRGYGGASGQGYGAGRLTLNEQLWGFPCEFKLLKLRVKASTNRRLKMVSVTLLMSRGSYQR